MAEPGQAAGIIGKRILSGEKVADIAVQTIDPNHFMVDARQLTRWGISKDRLPPVRLSGSSSNPRGSSTSGIFSLLLFWWCFSFG